VLQAGSTCSVGDDLPATAAKINVPRGLAVDAAGTVYVADVGNHRIRKISAGIITTVAGTGSPGYNLTEDGGPATLAKINRPFDVNVSISGNVYVADTSNHLIRKIDTAGTITTVAGTGTTGSSGDGGPAILAEIDAPHGVAVDSAENVYIADRQHQPRPPHPRRNHRDHRRRRDRWLFGRRRPGPGGAAQRSARPRPRPLGHDVRRGHGQQPRPSSQPGRPGDDRAGRAEPVVEPTLDRRHDRFPLRLERRGSRGRLGPSAGDRPGGRRAPLLRHPAGPRDDPRWRSLLRAQRHRRNGTIDQLVLKYERAALDDWITADPALGLRIEGQFPGSPVATTFSGDAVIRVFQSHD
jgi:hypothetical protein